MSSQLRLWTGRVVLALLVLLLAGAAVAAALPIDQDPFIPDDEAGAGSSAVDPAYSGLQRDFPALETPSAEMAELGRQLFYDPILSGDNTMSCADCHHPDRGFADGRPQSIAASGVALDRNAPTLWNIGYRSTFFWDGRVDSLEAQAAESLRNSSEMNAVDDDLVAELAAIDAYQPLFAAAYGDDAITFDRITAALAAFERTLLTADAPFDRYAAGDFGALTSQQRRGLALFRSGATRCFECHTAPTFASETMRVIGVDSPDPGRAGVVADGADGAFRVPSLRNIALTGPYMHDGSMETLREVVQFYADGGGKAHGRTDLDPFVNGFTLTEQEMDDLVAFLFALTDENSLPAVPDVAVSGLPTVAREADPDREVVQTHNITADGIDDFSRPAETFTATPDDNIQAIVDQMQPGDTLRIAYGVYNQRVSIDISDVTVEGIPNDAGDYPIFDGQNALPEAFLASGNNFKIGYLHIRNYTDNGILVEGVIGVHMHDLISEDTGTYGIYPAKSTNVLVERVVASGVDDAAIYAGQCENVIVRDSEAFGSVLGIEIENTINGDVYNNYVHDNSLGILYVVLPQLHSKVSRGGRVYDNVVENNNIDNFAKPNTAAALVPPGVGILLLASDDIEVTNNVIRGNKTTGTAVFSLTAAYDLNEIDVGPNPEGNWIHNNVYDNNGYDPDAYVRDLGIPTGDVLWDGAGWDNRFDEPNANGGFPPWMPGKGVPTPIAKVYWRLLNAVIGLVS